MSAPTNPFFHASEVVHMELERGAMVIIQGLKAKAELNGKVALILGPRIEESGRIPCCLAPVLVTDDLMQLAARPENLRIAPHPPQVMSHAWNNASQAYKRAGKLLEADDAAALAHEFAPDNKPALANWIKLVLTMRRDGVGDDMDELQDRIGRMMGKLFAPVSSLPEFRGLDCCFGYDHVPGYTERQLMMGISNSVDSQPARSQWARQWIFDQSSHQLVEVQQGAGDSKPMSETAKAAMQSGPLGVMHREVTAVRKGH